MSSPTMMPDSKQIPLQMQHEFWFERRAAKTAPVAVLTASNDSPYRGMVQAESTEPKAIEFQHHFLGDVEM